MSLRLRSVLPGPIDRLRLAAILAAHDFGLACHPHIVSELRLRSATIEDLGNKNGTPIEGSRLIGAAGFRDGDGIDVGSSLPAPVRASRSRRLLRDNEPWCSTWTSAA
jgi:hypothetical protein